MYFKDEDLDRVQRVIMLLMGGLSMYIVMIALSIVF